LSIVSFGATGQGEHGAGAGGVDEFEGTPYLDPKPADCRDAVHPGAWNSRPAAAAGDRALRLGSTRRPNSAAFGETEANMRGPPRPEIRNRVAAVLDERLPGDVGGANVFGNGVELRFLVTHHPTVNFPFSQGGHSIEIDHLTAAFDRGWSTIPPLPRLVSTRCHALRSSTTRFAVPEDTSSGPAFLALAR
jgi:hypothetical protein